MLLTLSFSVKVVCSAGPASSNVSVHQVQIHQMGPSHSGEIGAVTSPSTSATGAPARPRMRCTPELHERFVEAVIQLGGSESMLVHGSVHILDVSEFFLIKFKICIHVYTYVFTPRGYSQRRAESNESRWIDYIPCEKPPTGVLLVFFWKYIHLKKAFYFLCMHNQIRLFCRNIEQLDTGQIHLKVDHHLITLHCIQFSFSDNQIYSSNACSLCCSTYMFGFLIYSYIYLTLLSLFGSHRPSRLHLAFF